MRYARSIRFAGDPAKAVEIAMTVLLANDFRLISKTADRLEFAGPGVMSKRRNAIAGVSWMEVSATKGELAIDAQLGGVHHRAVAAIGDDDIGSALSRLLGLAHGIAIGVGDIQTMQHHDLDHVKALSGTVVQVSPGLFTI